MTEMLFLLLPLNEALYHHDNEKRRRLNCPQFYQSVNDY